jgi:hypothetical protein
MNVLNLTDEYVTVHNHDGSCDQLEPALVACRTLRALGHVPPQPGEVYIVTPELWSLARENGFEPMNQLAPVHGELPDGRFIGHHWPGPQAAEAATCVDDEAPCTD